MDVDHIGIAVQSIATSLPKWELTLGGRASAPEEVAAQHVRVAFMDVGATHLELLEPTDPSSTIARFLATHGEGMHHIAFAVPSVSRQLAELVQRGERVIDQVGRPGARGRIVGFAHPSAFGGVLVEFVERR
ncbi:MAG: methylmalonyl-CoA epimerase [Thermoplasmata archaeon]|nr:methylmalonyl-CoA epimerase [Thermoplasmata archaeon]